MTELVTDTPIKQELVPLADGAAVTVSRPEGARAATFEIRVAAAGNDSVVWMSFLEAVDPANRMGSRNPVTAKAKHYYRTSHSPDKTYFQAVGSAAEVWIVWWK